MTRKLLPILLLFALLTAPCYAQGIPVNVPDTPGESPADREREQLEERYRPLLSRLYVRSQLVAPVAVNSPFLSFQLSAGYERTNGDAFYTITGVQEVFPVGEDAPDSRLQTVYVLGAGYALHLGRFLPGSAHADRSTLGLEIGSQVGHQGRLSMELAPTYEIPVSHHWSVPVGLKLGTLYVGNDEIRDAYVGVSAGVKMYLGKRDHLE